MRPTESKVFVDDRYGRRAVYVTTMFTDCIPHKHFQDIKVEVRDSAVCLSDQYDGRIYLTLESLPRILEAIEQAKG